MDAWFLLKCFLVGISVASAVGPIFVLTFNRGALHGFLKGFFTALGAAVGDGLLFFLGLFGVLNFLENAQKSILLLDLIGGIIILILGIRMIRSRKNYLQASPLRPAKHAVTMTKAFILTVINPLTIFFFMFISVKIIPDGFQALPLNLIASGSAMVFAGSLSMLSCVALIASLVRHALSPQRLALITYVTGIIFITISLYFFYESFLSSTKLFNFFV